MEENSCIRRVSFSIQNRYLHWKYHEDSERWDFREQHFEPNMRNKTSRNPALIWEGRGAFMWMNRPFPGLSCVQNLSYEDEFDSHDTEPVSGTHFHINRFARRLLFGKRPNTTRKWPTKFIKRNCVKKWLKWKILSRFEDISVPLTHLWMSESLKVLVICLITFWSVLTGCLRLRINNS